MNLSMYKRLLVAALGTGLWADYLFYQRWLGISVPLFVLIGLALLGLLAQAEGRAPARANLWLAGGALLFASCVALRDSPFLVALDLLATIGLLLLFVGHYSGAALLRLPLVQVLGRGIIASAEISLRPFQMFWDLRGLLRLNGEHTRRLVPVGRGLMLATPVLLVFTLLLTMADSVFMSYVTRLIDLDLPFSIETALGHALVVSAIGWLYAGGALTALKAGGAQSIFTQVGAEADRLAERAFGPEPSGSLPAEGDTQPLTALARQPFRLGNVEALTVLLLVDVLFGCFMLVQAAYLFGGRDTLELTGMTYANYARRGFFELVAVACLSIGLLWLLALLTSRETKRQRRRFNSAGLALIGLVLGMLVSAFLRMALYEQVYGYTRLRLYTHSFMIWLALVLLLLALALMRSRLRLFSFGAAISALVYLALLNAANPDALIVQENIARYQASGDLDTDYLRELSADAAPALEAALPQLSGAARADVAAIIAEQRKTLSSALEQQGWPIWTLPRAQALGWGDRARR